MGSPFSRAARAVAAVVVMNTAAAGLGATGANAQQVAAGPTPPSMEKKVRPASPAPGMRPGAANPATGHKYSIEEIAAAADKVGPDEDCATFGERVGMADLVGISEVCVAASNRARKVRIACLESILEMKKTDPAAFEAKVKDVGPPTRENACSWISKAGQKRAQAG